MSWQPSSNKTPITSYLLARDDGAGAEAGPWSNNYPATTTPLDFLYLKTGTYKFSVAPINARGCGPTTTLTIAVKATLLSWHEKTPLLQIRF